MPTVSNYPWDGSGGGGRRFTHPDVFGRGVAEGWADPESDPTRIDWAARKARDPLAFAPGFELVDGRPFYPHAVTGVRYGRNELGHWGPQLCADALVTATTGHGSRWLLMVERGDGHGWAVPGGHVDPGEDPTDAAFRELGEETGLVVDRAGVRYNALAVRYVPDPRASDEAWMVTVPVLVDLGVVDVLPVVSGRDDARRAVWVSAVDYAGLTRHLSAVYSAQVFPAHVDLLREVFG